MIITSRQREELHKAILAYFTAQGFSDSATMFRGETGVTEEVAGDLLEKKWTSVVRLQKKVMDLQAEIEAMKSEMSYFQPGQKLVEPGANEGLPTAPEKFLLVGHRDTVTCVTFHPVYSTVASSSEDGSIRLWDYESGQLDQTLKGHTQNVNYIAFEPNQGNMLASCSADLTIKLWLLESFECIKTLSGHDHNVSCVQFVPSGDYLLSASRDKSVKLWEVATGYCIKTYLGHQEWVRQTSIHYGGAYFASASNDETICLWTIDNTSPIQIMSGHDHVVETVEFANENATKTLAETFSRAPVGATQEEEKTSREPLYLASGSRDKKVCIWDCWGGTALLKISGHDNWVRGLQFHPNGLYLYSASDDKSIRIWDIATGRCKKRLNDAHAHFVTCLALNPRFPLLASGSVDKGIKLWTCR